MNGELTKKVLEAKNGNKEAMADVVRIMYPSIYKYGKTLAFDGVETDLAIHLIEKIYSVREKTIYTFNDKQMYVYLKNVIKNKTIDISRKKYVETVCLDFLEALSSTAIDDFSLVYFNDMLRNLSKKQSMVVYYKYQLDYSDSEIGKIMNISRQAVNRLHNRALDNIRKEITEQ